MSGEQPSLRHGNGLRGIGAAFTNWYGVNVFVASHQSGSYTVPEPRKPQNVAARRRALEAQRRQIVDQIRAYPGPIAGCDAQFNALLAERQEVVAKLRSLSDTLAGR